MLHLEWGLEKSLPREQSWASKVEGEGFIEGAFRRDRGWDCEDFPASTGFCQEVRRAQGLNGLTLLPLCQVRVEVQYRGDLALPVTLEAHVINDAAHSKVATWLPQSEKMQAELEGNRISRTLNVRAAVCSTALPGVVVWAAVLP